MLVSDFIKKPDLDKLEIKNYVGVNEKMFWANHITETCCLDEDKNLKLNTNSMYIFTILKLIDLYTDIDIDFKNVDKEYDLLAADDLIEGVCSRIPEKETDTFIEMVTSAKEDLIQNTSTPHAYITHQVERFGKLTGATLEPVMNNIANYIAELDEKKINAIGKNVVKVVNKIK